MFLHLLLSFSSSEVITCSHDFNLDKELRGDDPIPLVKRSGKAYSIGSKDQPFRLCFDMKSIDDGTIDNCQCKSGSAGSVPSGCGNQNHDSTQCLETDVLDANKRKVIKDTFANVKEFLESNLNVTVDTQTNEVTKTDCEYTNFDSLKAQGKLNASQCDLFIAVYARPFGSGSSGLAFAQATATSSVDRRPVRGKITVNPSKIPSEAQSFRSGNRQFIITVLHEINHILSFSSGLFEHWLNEDTNEAYGSSIFVYADKEGHNLTNAGERTNKLVHQFLHTPSHTKWVNERFHVETEGYKHWGLEIEDGGGSGTAGSHPNERLYFTDLMQGRTYGPGYIGPIFYNSLKDSNWYNPSENIIEKLTYLDDKYEVDSQTNERILFGPPQNTFPSSHICEKNQATSCFYDYIYAGLCSLKEKNSITKADFTSYSDYYNPNDRSLVGQDDLLDYVPTVLPWYNCRDPGAGGKERRGYSADGDPEDFGELYDNASVCAISTLYKSAIISAFSSPRCYHSFCGDDMKVRIVVDGVQKVCNKDGKKLRWEGYSGYVICPPSSVVCANRNEYVHVLPITSMTPDRGPIDGKNLVSIKGTNFGGFTNETLEIILEKLNAIFL